MAKKYFFNDCNLHLDKNGILPWAYYFGLEFKFFDFLLLCCVSVFDISINCTLFVFMS